jgi:hypothetical protein
MYPPPPSVPPEPELRLHTSWRGLLGALVTPFALLGLGGLAIRDGGVRAFPLLLVALGVVLLLVVLFDYPHTATVGRQGISRQALLRTQLLPWDRLVALERTRPATATVLRNLTDRHADPQVSGGLVARGRGRRRWLLTDRVESRIEYDRLVALLAEMDGPVGLHAARPHAEAAPTFLYRRREPGGPTS